jgi:hypothetical protein
MAVWYLDNDDEITDAVARLRNATDEQIVFVVPTGSRIATGRINFKLLHREAAARGLSLAIASPDAQVRAMAASAGVLGLATAAEAEAALERGDTPPEATEAGPSEPASAAAGAEEGSAGAGTAAAVGAASSRRRVSRRMVVVAGGVLTVAVIGVVASLQTLPTAQVTLTPRTATIGPLPLTITALTTVSEPDPETGRLPAVDVAIPLSTEQTYRASGREIVEARATGSVTLTSVDQPFEQSIPTGTRVSTPAGIEFRTTEPVVMPRAATGGGSSQVTVPVEAVAPGGEGNVAAGEISLVPSLEAQGITVSNPEATAGGRYEETPVVTQEDYEAALADLQNRLVGELAARLRDPERLPEDLTVFTATAEPGIVEHLPPAEEVVGSRSAEFTLAGDLAAHVLAVDERSVDALARSIVLAELPEGMAVLPGRLSVEAGDGVAEDGGIRFDGTASAVAYQVIDEEAVLARIAGLPVSEARAILEDIGATTVSVWPEFLGDLPSDRNRIRLDVLDPSASE